MGGFSTQTNFGERVPDLTAYLVMSHELGHNFGSSHDSEEQSSGGQFLMWPVSVDGTEDNNYLFSPQSLSVIGEVITAKGGCFIASDEPTCGNGVQEGSEPCDCGGNPSLCSQFDSCCEIGCTLASGAECSPQNTQNGTCCTSGCQKITDTSTVYREEQVCTEQSTCTADGECPTPANRPDSPCVPRTCCATQARARAPSASCGTLRRHRTQLATTPALCSVTRPTHAPRTSWGRQPTVRRSRMAAPMFTTATRPCSATLPRFACRTTFPASAMRMASACPSTGTFTLTRLRTFSRAFR